MPQGKYGPVTTCILGPLVKLPLNGCHLMRLGLPENVIGYEGLAQDHEPAVNVRQPGRMSSGWHCSIGEGLERDIDNIGSS